MYTLIIDDRHGRSAAEISFDQGSYTIGRVDGNDVVLPSNSVSRTHARIFVSNNKCYIVDLGSANGVLVDGVQIKDRTEIRNGSKIRIGEYTLYLEYKDQTEIAPGQDVLKTQIVSGAQSGFKIVRVSDKFAGEEFMLSEATNTIGRTEDNYILLSDQSISRNHAKITNRGMNFFVSDLSSSNGTFVNNKRINAETSLQPGDLIRFGNVSFVFVPSSERVDLHQYAKKKGNDNRKIIIGFIVFIFLIIIVMISSAVIISNNKNAQQPVAQPEVSEEQMAAKRNENFDKAKNLVEEKRFAPAKDLVDELLKENANDKQFQELSEKIDFEIKNETFIKDGKAFLDNNKFLEAIDLFKQVSMDSSNYDTANELIKDTERKLRLTTYNEARSRCDDGVSEECIKALCNATLELGESDSEQSRITETKEFMERITSSKQKKYLKAAQNCLDALNN
ncbi:MAG: FHA domain-containing protein [Proteobacteria bacterium]|nr:FHA domain-containing protein [Pseudomonadota bacterium]